MTLWVPILVAAVAAAGTYLVARQKSSGRIGTSEASDLWAESQAIRRELRDEVTALRNQIRSDEDECARQITLLQQQIAALRGAA